MTAHGGLEISEDIAQQEKVWRGERLAWTLIGLVIVAALLGLAGHGHFSARVIQATDAGLAVSWQRFERYHAATLLSVRLAAASTPQTRLRVGTEFLRSAVIEHIEPEPARVELDDSFVTYVFDTNAPGTVLFHYLPTRFGSVRIVLGLEGRPLVALPQFVYP